MCLGAHQMIIVLTRSANERADVSSWNLDNFLHLPSGRSLRNHLLKPLLVQIKKLKPKEV